jgi:hypothetical protein
MTPGKCLGHSSMLGRQSTGLLFLCPVVTVLGSHPSNTAEPFVQPLRW